MRTKNMLQLLSSMNSNSPTGINSVYTHGGCTYFLVSIGGGSLTVSELEDELKDLEGEAAEFPCLRQVSSIEMARPIIQVISERQRDFPLQRVSLIA